MPHDSHAARASFVERRELALSLLRTCGYGRMLLMGLTSPALVEDLVAEGVDAWALAPEAEVPQFGGRYARALPAMVNDAGAFDTVVALTDAAGVEAAAVFARAARQYYVVVDADAASTWTALAHEAGLSPHPFRHLVDIRDDPCRHATLVFEKPAAAAVQGIGDAPFHVSALRYVRPGDTVLDLTGDDEGASRLVRASKARRVVRDLDSPADLVLATCAMGDVVTTAERLRPHVADAGRCILRLEGGSEAGGLPQPAERLGHSGFFVEAVVPTPGAEAGALALVLLADLGWQAPRSPDAGRDEPNIVAFERDYATPAVVRGLVSIGLRTESRALREAMANRLIASEPAESADYGAALCVLCYAVLERRGGDDELAPLFASAMDFASSGEAAANPTVVRWRISLAFVAASIALRLGDRDRARASLVLTTRIDPLAFSPLVATKTVAAWRILGTLALADGDLEAAADAWRDGVRAAKRVLVEGDWREILGEPSAPVTFGPPEAAAVLLEAARCQSSLANLAHRTEGPVPDAWSALHGTVIDELAAERLAMEAARSEIERQASALKWAEEHRVATDAWVEALNDGKAWLEDQRRGWENEAVARAARIEGLEASLAAAEASRDDAKATLDDVNADIARLRAEFAESARLTQLLHDEFATLSSRMEQQERDDAVHARVTDLLQYIAELQDAKEWLVGQVASHQREMIERGEHLSESRTYVRQLLEGKAWLEGQVENLDEHATKLLRDLGRARDELGHVQRERGMLVERLAELVAERDAGRQEAEKMAAELRIAEERAVQLDEQRQMVAQQRDELSQLNKAIAGYVYDKEISQKDVVALKGKLALAQADCRMLISAAERNSRQVAQITSARWVRLGRWLGLLRSINGE